MTAEEYNVSVDYYADNLYRFLLKNTGDSQLAEDLLQETFLRVWERCDKVVFDSVKSYLFTIAYRLFIDHYRLQKKKTSLEEIDSKMSFSNEQAHGDLNQLLNQALERLPAQQKTLLLLRDYEGYSYDEIAAITDLSLEQVKVYLFRARKVLKNYLVRVEVLV